MFFGTDNTTASKICLKQLAELGNGISFLSRSPASFHKCLYVQETLGKAFGLDWLVLYGVFLLVAMLMAEDQRQQQLMCRLRRIILPLPLCPEKTTDSILRWLGTLLLIINEFTISLVAPLLPFGTVFLMLTKGINVSSALLNGLTMGFVLQIDNLVPTVFISPKVLKEVETYLVDKAKREMAKKDANGFYGYITASPFIAVATVFMGFITQYYVLDASRSINCERLVAFVHYHGTIFFGLWCTGALCFATEVGTRAIIGRQQRQELRSSGSSRASTSEDAPVPSASCMPKWAAAVLSMLVDLTRRFSMPIAVTRRFAYLLIAAITLNSAYIHSVVDLYFAHETTDARDRLAFILPVFGQGLFTGGLT